MKKDFTCKDANKIGEELRDELKAGLKDELNDESQAVRIQKVGNGIKKKGFIIWNGEIAEVDILWMRESSDWILISLPNGENIYITKEAIYPDRETPERILEERRKAI